MNSNEISFGLMTQYPVITLPTKWHCNYVFETFCDCALPHV